MATERGRQLVLGLLVIGLAFAIYRLWPATSAAEVPSSNSSSRSSGTTAAKRQPTPAEAAAPGVNLEALNSARPKPEAAERNLFRFKPKAPPPAPPPISSQPAMPVNPEPTGPPPPPSVPPIALKFIGIIESPTSAKKIAVLSDGRNPPYQGVEGDIIEGRYRILKIGVESIELAYTDGRGRQTIRLTGS
jgi:hypothetical protein